MQFFLDDKTKEKTVVPDAISERENLREALSKARESIRVDTVQEKENTNVIKNSE